MQKIVPLLALWITLTASQLSQAYAQQSSASPSSVRESDVAAVINQIVESRSSEKNLHPEITALMQKAATWKNNPTQANWIDLNGAIDKAAQVNNVTSKVKFTATDGPGAAVLYQTQGARQRHEHPSTAANPTDCMEVMNIGFYFVWAERHGKATSNQDTLITVKREEQPVTLIEDRAPTAAQRP